MDSPVPIPITLPPDALARLLRAARNKGMSPATLAHILLLQALCPDTSTAPVPGLRDGRDALPRRDPHPSLFSQGPDEDDDVILIEED